MKGIPGFRLWLTLALLAAVAVSTRYLDAQTLPMTTSLASSVAGGASGCLNWNNDTFLCRDAADTLAQKDGTAAQTFRVYGTTTGSRYIQLDHDGTNGTVTTSAGRILLNPTTYAGVNATLDLAGNLLAGGSAFGTNDVGLVRSSAGLWNITNGSAGSGGLAIATVTTFNASATLTNRPMNFKDLNLFLTAAGMQGWCGNCAPASAIDQTCVSGSGGSIAIRDGAGVFKCIS